jgi:YVTN family beta-propeller protein
MKPLSLLALALSAALLATAASTAGAAGPAGAKAYVGNFKDDTVSVVDTGGHAMVATIPVAAGPDGIVVSRNDRLVFVSGSGSSSLSVIDTATDRIVDTIEVGKGPQGLAATPDGRWLLAAINGEDRVAFIDIASRKVVGSVAVPKPHTVSISPDGKQAYVSSQAPGQFALAVLDLPGRTVAATVPVEKTPRDLEISPDGKTVYVTMAGAPMVQVFDTATNQVVAQIPTGVSPHVAHLFAGAPAGVVVVQGPGELMLFDPATHAATGSIAVGKQPHWVDILPGARQALVTNEGSNNVSLVDLGGGPVVTIPVGNAPRKVAVQHRASAAGGAKVSIRDFAFGPDQVAIRTGDSVTWSNDDGAPHGLGFKDGAPGTNELLPGQSFSRVFDKAGVYDYVCSVHPYMTAKVTVSDLSASADSLGAPR